MKSIRIKLVFWMCILFVLIGALIYIPLSSILPQKITSQILKRDLEIAQHLSGEAKNLLLLNDKIALPILLYDNLDRVEDAQYLFVQGPGGEIIAHTFGEGFPKGLLNFNLVKGEHKIREFLNNGNSIYDIAVPILDGSVGVLHLGVSLESGKKDIAEITKINYYVAVVILIGLGIGILVFLIIGFLFSNRIINLKNFAVRIGKGELDGRIDIKSKDEIGDLALAFNEMAMNLKEKIQEIKRLHIIEERNRIALDLHDGRAQDLANIIKRIELSKRLFDIDKRKAFEELDLLKEQTKNVLNRTRQVIHDLKSPEDSVLQFEDRLNKYFENYERENNIKIKSEIPGFVNNIISEKSKTVFYIIAEALNNIKKHSMARCIEVNLRLKNNHLTIDIKDDGRGFNVEKALSDNVKCGSLGLFSMRQRALALGGTFNITSILEGGTNIFIHIPLKEIMIRSSYEI